MAITTGKYVNYIFCRPDDIFRKSGFFHRDSGLYQVAFKMIYWKTIRLRPKKTTGGDGLYVSTSKRCEAEKGISPIANVN